MSRYTDSGDKNKSIIKKWWFWLIIIIVIIAIATQGGNNDNTQTGGQVANSGQVVQKVYGLNEVVPFEKNGNKYTLEITGIKEMSERNEYSDKSPAQVFLIDYTYKNEQGNELYISDLDFSVIDEQSEMGYTYPNSITNYPQNTPSGASCKAQMIFGINNKSSKITLTYKDNMFSSNADIKFEISI